MTTERAPAPDEAPSAAAPRRRALRLAIALAAVAFGTAVVVSGARQAVPAAVTPSAGPSASVEADGRLGPVTLRDVDRRPFEVPDGRPGAVVTFTTAGCRPCMAAIRRLGEAVDGLEGPVLLIAAGLEPGISAADLRAVERLVPSGARLIADSRSGELYELLGHPEQALTLVFGADGQVVDRLTTEASVAEVRRALRRAGAR